MHITKIRALVLTFTIALASAPVLAVDPQCDATMSEHDSLLPKPLADAARAANRANIPMTTLGGKQFWGDELVFHSWRIQRHVLTHHCRLIDPEDVRHAWGTFEECRAVLDRLRNERAIPPMRDRVVLVLHGLIRTRSAMLPLANFLSEHMNSAEVVALSYPSTRANVAQHAAALAKVVENLGPEVTQIDFVAHSLGNIVIRHYLADSIQRRGGVDPRLHRMVMIAPPNGGSLRAMEWSRNPLFKLVMGNPGQELSVRWEQLQQHLATPPFEFAVIAGAKGDGIGWKSYLPGDDDGCVSVSTTRLPGAADFVTLPVKHTFIMNDQRVQEAAARFLEHGYLRSPELKNPIRE